MISVIYTIVFLLASFVIIPFLLFKVIVRKKYRTGIPQRFGYLKLPADKANDQWIWIHAVSVGEVQVALPLVKLIQSREPHLRILITTTTDTGQAVAQKTSADYVAYFPFDFPGNAVRALQTVKPVSCLFTETEIWPNFLFATQKLGIRCGIINGRISDRSFKRYRLIRFFMKRLLQIPRLCCMQSKEDATRIVELGALTERVEITGNMKFDRALEMVKESSRDIRTELGIPSSSKLIIGGSVHGKESEYLITAFKQLRERFHDLILLLAPRHLTDLESIEELARNAGLRSIRKTQLVITVSQSHSYADKPFSWDIILLDTIGELAYIYAAGDIAYVGGSLVPHGGQNMLEPAILGKPTVFGPHTHNFKESVALLLANGCALQINDPPALTQALEQLLSDPKSAQQMGNRARQTVRAAGGAAERTYALLKTHGFFTKTDTRLSPPQVIAIHLFK